MALQSLILEIFFLISYIKMSFENKLVSNNKYEFIKVRHLC